jgi:hypothetical protein
MAGTGEVGVTVVGGYMTSVAKKTNKLLLKPMTL